MDKQAHIDDWILLSQEEEKTMVFLLNGGKQTHALLFAHRMFEKICNALWVKNRVSNVAPKTLRIDKLLNRLNIDIDSRQGELIKKLVQFKMQVCYPNQLITPDKISDKNFEKDCIHRIAELKFYLLNKLQ
jgi:hypothetical protein